ncbi:hypothetical protein LSTR_LSTR012665 [Laodelphax striatellus]|uniref:Uncharacterized protein n=1 Tax=Laodelphax striatellus TaxID=195883 RepID=A0A482X8T2_LAOST|nr:hypothetical protein LSTR_LSTR012665 [Laodelphax striatellus]
MLYLLRAASRRMEIDLETRGIDRGNLALSLSTAVHLVIPVSFLDSNNVTLLISVLLSLGISQIQSRCKRKPASSIALHSQLMWCGLTSLVCTGLTASLCEVDVLHVCGSLGGHVTAVRYCQHSLCGVTGLCALGLERSGILRFLLTISIAASSLLIMASSDLTAIFKQNVENNSTEHDISVSMVPGRLSQRSAACV